MALVFVLWIVVLLTAIAFQMAYRGHLRARISATTGDSTQAFFLARSGVEMAISDLVENATSAADQATLREESERLYKDIELGNGAYTLLADAGGSNPAFGFIDECAKLNINTVTVEMLGRLTLLKNGLAEAILALRQEEESFSDLDALLLIDGVDRLDLYGEDQNRNGLLDSNEDDGDQNWPPDDADGRLNSGLAACLTVWSAVRDVDQDGDKRLNLQEASAEEITASLTEISTQQADSIVHHRDQGQFSSIFDLLNVELIEKVKNEGQNPDPNQGNPNPDRPGPGNRPQQAGQGGENEAKPAEKQNEGASDNPESGKKPDGDPAKPGDPSEADRQAEAEKKKAEASEYTFKQTGKKAFDEESFRKIADRLTTSEEDVLQGSINVNTASIEVLACLPDIDESVALAIVQERQNRVGGFQTIFDLLDVRGISSERIKGLAGLISVRSDVFSVCSFGVMRDQRTVASVSAVLDRTEDAVKVRCWRENG